MKEIGQWFATILAGGYMFVLVPLVSILSYLFFPIAWIIDKLGF